MISLTVIDDVVIEVHGSAHISVFIPTSLLPSGINLVLFT